MEADSVEVIVGLSYAEIHLYFTIPITFVLWLIARPFIDGFLKGNIVFLCTLAVFYTTPWDHFLIETETWSYSDSRVIPAIWGIPLEEYFFFIIQTVMVSLWAFLCLRWSIPTLYLAVKSPIKANLIRWTPIPFVVAASVISWTNLTAPKTPYFYMSCIIGWALPVIGFLWIGAGNYVLKRIIPVIITILGATIYLCFVDLIALRAGAWVINPSSTVGVYVYDILPLEEALFFLIVNTLLVIAVCAFEKSFAILHSFPELFKNGSFIKNLFQAFLIIESSLPQEPISDLRKAIAVLKQASKSFWAASFIFPAGMRQDLSILYAFCRVTDDMADDSSLTPDEKLEKVGVIKEFLDQLFQNRDMKSDWTYGLGKKSRGENSGEKGANALSQIHWKYFEGVLSGNELASFRSLSRIAYYLPPEPFYELCKGYEWDISGRPVKTKEELVEYSEYVASSVGVLCTYVMCNGTRGWFGSWSGRLILEEKDREIIDAARCMGVCLQLVNISRDIVTDSETLGRCYVPLEFFDIDKRNEQYDMLTVKREPWQIGEERLRELGLQIIQLGDEFKAKGQRGIAKLPMMARRPVVCATDIYSIIGKIIKKNPGYVKRASAKTSTKIGVLVKSIYLPLEPNCK